MKLVGYVRASVHDPVEGFLSPEEQEKRIARMARAGHHRLLAVVRDAGMSAAEDLGTRIGFAEVLARVRDGAAEGVAVARLDRLSEATVMQELLIAELGRMGARVLSAAREDADALAGEPSDPARALARQVIDATRDYDRAMRDLRVLHRAGAESRLLADLEHAAMSRIEQLAEQGAPVREIARTLSAEGFSPRFSYRWNLPGLKRILARIAPQRPS